MLTNVSTSESFGRVFPTDPDPGPAVENAELLARWGRSPISPFLTEPGNATLQLSGGGLSGYRAVRRWAVFATDPASPPGLEDDGLSSLLDQVARARLRPVFAAVANPEPYRARGMHPVPIADDARIDLRAFSLAGKRMASIRHSITSARKAGLVMVPWSIDVAAGVEQVSSEWLATKRGGELGFTLGRFDRAHVAAVDCRAAVAPSGQVVGFVTWRTYDDGRARVLDLIRRAVGAPNPTMDFLIGESLLEFARSGVEAASLGAVPLSRGRLAERIYPTVSLRRYKEKFAPVWHPLWLIAPSHLQVAGSLLSVAGAYCPGGLSRALRRNA
jgi:lysylphosphatidylglycerol synthetase-like protein (DUF2156 family)